MCVAYHPASKRTIAGAILLANMDSARFTAMKQLFDATIATLDGETPPTISDSRCAASCQVYDDSPVVIPVIQQNADEITVPASTTKILSSMVALDSVVALEPKRTVLSNAVQSGGNLTTNDTILLDDLLSDLLLLSVNTAAYVIADMCGEVYSIIQDGNTPV